VKQGNIQVKTKHLIETTFVHL